MDSKEVRTEPRPEDLPREPGEFFLAALPYAAVLVCCINLPLAMLLALNAYFPVRRTVYTRFHALQVVAVLVVERLLRTLLDGHELLRDAINRGEFSTAAAFSAFSSFDPDLSIWSLLLGLILLMVSLVGFFRTVQGRDTVVPIIGEFVYDLFFAREMNDRVIFAGSVMTTAGPVIHQTHLPSRPSVDYARKRYNFQTVQPSQNTPEQPPPSTPGPAESDCPPNAPGSGNAASPGQRPTEP